MIYSDGFVEVYDSIYSRMKNYEDEAAKVKFLIKKLRPEAKTILDVACCLHHSDGPSLLF